MKTKEIIELGVAIVVLVVAGYFIVGIMSPKKGASKQTTYEVVSPIPSDFDQDALTQLRNTSNARNFYTRPDLHNGIGNPHPFSSGQ